MNLHGLAQVSADEEAEYIRSHYRCGLCLDNQWRPSCWCDGFGKGAGKVRRDAGMVVQWCGDDKHHQGHSYTPGRCFCWPQVSATGKYAAGADVSDQPRRRK